MDRHQKVKELKSPERSCSPILQWSLLNCWHRQKKKWSLMLNCNLYRSHQTALCTYPQKPFCRVPSCISRVVLAIRAGISVVYTSALIQSVVKCRHFRHILRCNFPETILHHTLKQITNLGLPLDMKNGAAPNIEMIGNVC